MMKKFKGLTAEQKIAKNKRDQQLETVRIAIGAGKAYLDTCFGRYKVFAYNDNSGWATCYPANSDTQNNLTQRSFMVCLENIQISA